MNKSENSCQNTQNSVDINLVNLNRVLISRYFWLAHISLEIWSIRPNFLFRAEKYVELVSGSEPLFMKRKSI